MRLVRILAGMTARRTGRIVARPFRLARNVVAWLRVRVVEVVQVVALCAVCVSLWFAGGWWGAALASVVVLASVTVYDWAQGKARARPPGKDVT